MYSQENFQETTTAPACPTNCSPLINIAGVSTCVPFVQKQVGNCCCPN